MALLDADVRPLIILLSMLMSIISASVSLSRIVAECRQCRDGRKRENDANDGAGQKAATIILFVEDRRAIIAIPEIRVFDCLFDIIYVAELSFIVNDVTLADTSIDYRRRRLSAVYDHGPSVHVHVPSGDGDGDGEKMCVDGAGCCDGQNAIFCYCSRQIFATCRK